MLAASASVPILDARPLPVALAGNPAACPGARQASVGVEVEPPGVAVRVGDGAWLKKPRSVVGLDDELPRVGDTVDEQLERVSEMSIRAQRAPTPRD